MSRIEWTETTWNPTTGCDRVSPGCDRCYALTMAGRLKAIGSAKYQTDGSTRTSGPGFGLAVHPDTLTAPLHWTAPRLVFVNSMSDLFHAHVPTEFIARVWAVMAATPRHTYQVLTKRHARMRSVLTSERFMVGFYAAYRAYAGDDLFPPSWPAPNVWVGVSAENQKWADIRLPALARTPAVVRFVSAEPLVGPLRLHRGHGHCPTHDFRGGHCSGPCPNLVTPDWVIIGGESGPGARPLDLEWARVLRDQAHAAGAKVFIKQLGAAWAREAGVGGKGTDPDSWPDDLNVRRMPTPRQS
ncbi:phage Gp37/Gp68 family protein [Nocardiopsis sp. NPDC049922]|uniref:phage Gp37/Gp68 family protein n=1 Tax=Nocardiopsis sp. NPDC049922 TaxID=3155157 RepID=UPI0033FA42DD